MMCKKFSRSPQKVSRKKQYEELLPQLKSLIESETDLVAVMANVAASLKRVFPFFWCGFYIVKGDFLMLGPFQGYEACSRIAYGKGVCGTSWKERRTIIVDDVEKFEGHIACSSESKSEIVVPILKGGIVEGVLDVDSDHLNFFDEDDRLYLEKIASMISAKVF